jgi:hypothetical protein
MLNQSQGYWLFLDAFVVTISLVCQMQLRCLAPNSSETNNFDEKFKSFNNTCKNKW